jgi:hypothetical protein
MPRGAPSSGDLDSRMQYIERILQLTRPERMVFLAISLTSALVLIVYATIILFRHGSDVGTITGLWGASGVVTLSNAQALRVWRDALRLVLPQLPKGVKE